MKYCAYSAVDNWQYKLHTKFYNVFWVDDVEVAWRVMYDSIFICKILSYPSKSQHTHTKTPTSASNMIMHHILSLTEHQNITYVHQWTLIIVAFQDKILVIKWYFQKLTKSHENFAVITSRQVAISAIYAKFIISNNAEYKFSFFKKTYWLCCICVIKDN